MKRVIFVGQAMPRNKQNPHDWPSLNSWLHKVGFTDDQIKKYFFYTALVDYFPGSKNGSHRIPESKEVEKERSRLKKTLDDFNPDIIVTIGKLSLVYCLNKKVNLLDEYVGRIYKADPYGLLGYDTIVIPFPHPSGASTWYHKSKNRKLLDRALFLLKENI